MCTNSEAGNKIHLTVLLVFDWERAEKGLWQLLPLLWANARISLQQWIGSWSPKKSNALLLVRNTSMSLHVEMQRHSLRPWFVPFKRLMLALPLGKREMKKSVHSLHVQQHSKRNDAGSLHATPVAMDWLALRLPGASMSLLRGFGDGVCITQCTWTTRSGTNCALGAHLKETAPRYLQERPDVLRPHVGYESLSKETENRSRRSFVRTSQANNGIVSNQERVHLYWLFRMQVGLHPFQSVWAVCRSDGMLSDPGFGLLRFGLNKL